MLPLNRKGQDENGIEVAHSWTYNTQVDNTLKWLWANSGHMSQMDLLIDDMVEEKMRQGPRTRTTDWNEVS